MVKDAATAVSSLLTSNVVGDAKDEKDEKLPNEALLRRAKLAAFAMLTEDERQAYVKAHRGADPTTSSDRFLEDQARRRFGESLERPIPHVQLTSVSGSHSRGRGRGALASSVEYRIVGQIIAVERSTAPPRKRDHKCDDEQREARRIVKAAVAAARARPELRFPL